MGINLIKSNDKKIMWWNDECKCLNLKQNLKLKKIIEKDKLHNTINKLKLN